jgi:hypothetical protein
MGGQTPEYVAEITDETLSHVKGLLRTEKLYRMALTLDYSEHVREKIQDPKFSLTTLERFIESTYGRNLLGIKLDDKLGFVGKVHLDKFKAVLREVAKDVATKRGLTRDINDKDGWEIYTSKVEKRVPKTLKRGSFKPSDILPDEDSEPEPEKQPAKPPARRARKKPPGIIPAGFTCTCKNDKIRAIFNELKLLKIDSHSNSTGVMLRVLLDIALWTYIENIGMAKKACDFADRKGRQRRNNSEWTPPLKKLITFAVKNRIFQGMPANGYKALQTLAAGDVEYFITIEGFNAFTHNPFVTPTEADLRSLWSRAEPMLEIILR